MDEVQTTRNVLGALREGGGSVEDSMNVIARLFVSGVMTVAGLGERVRVFDEMTARMREVLVAWERSEMQ